MDNLQDTRGDHYIGLMRDSRGLSPSQIELRELWFNALEISNKEDVLFELEMLLKGVVCLGSPRNHPGKGRLEGLDKRHFHRELSVLQHSFERIVEVCEQLVSIGGDLASSDIYMVSGPLENVSTPLIVDSFEQGSPDDSLRMLHSAFSDLAEMASTLTEQERIRYSTFRAMSATAGREVGRNAFFNPLVTLEFRTEYDHLQHIEVLHVVYGDGPDGAQRSATLSFLALYRLLRYLDIAEHYLDHGNPMLAFVPLAVARSDALALSGFMGEEARRWLSSGFEREVMTLSAREIVAASVGLEQDFRLLHDLGAVLRAVGDQLHLEIRKVFEQQLLPFAELLTPADLVGRTKRAISEFRDYLMQSVLRIAQVFKPELVGTQIFEAFVHERAQSERLRRDIWIFMQIMRGFLAKAAAAPEAVNSWDSQSSYSFVREFIVYFRNLGYHLLRTSEYQRFSEFMVQVEGLSATDVHDRISIDVFVQECEVFRRYLKDVFESLGMSHTLVNTTFDKHAAAQTLRLYLDHG